MLVDQNGTPLSCVVSPANIHDSRLYKPTIEAFAPSEKELKVKTITADAAYDTLEIRTYNNQNGIQTNIPINKRNTKDPENRRAEQFDLDLYKKRGAVERFFSWIEAFKKIVPRHERKEGSFIGLVLFACGIMIYRVLG
ncbi:transposase [Methanofollis fontis]|uniref:transposase n=1 Tax=Methanofollis fontis TaxID=2052832 RepID=UPI0013EEADBF|nr:transposase [Methanofollis fontis]